MKILVTGASGMLGSAIVEQLQSNTKWELYLNSRAYIGNTDYRTKVLYGDLTDANFISEISKVKYDVIVHTAAITDLNYCEKHEDVAEMTHLTVTQTLSEANHQALFIYISTDSIFDGEIGNYQEEDEAYPLNVYARTKFQGEKHIFNHHPNYFVLRLNIIGLSGRGSSLMKWGYRELSQGNMINGYTNMIFNPLHIKQISELISGFIQDRPERGIYHLGSSEPLSKFEFLDMVRKKFYLRGTVNPIQYQPFKEAIKRPLNTTLCINKVRKIFPHFDFSLMLQ